MQAGRSSSEFSGNAGLRALGRSKSDLDDAASTAVQHRERAYLEISPPLLARADAVIECLVFLTVVAAPAHGSFWCGGRRPLPGTEVP
jgi:hypothetical protein